MEEVKLTHRNKKVDRPMTFVEHLDRFRKHLFRGIFAVVLLSVVAFFFKDFLFNEIILKPKDDTFISNKILCLIADKINAPGLCVNQNNFNVINLDISGQFKAHLFISFLVGLIIAFPYLVFELWRFIMPALKAKERLFARKSVFWVSFLFSIGMLFGYFVILPLAIEFLVNYQASGEIENKITFTSYFSTITSLSLGSGLVFELPIIAYFLAKIGIIDYNFVKKYRKHAIVVAFIIAAILTPPDAFSQVLMAIPLVLLFEISVLIVKRVSKKRQISMQ